MEETVLTQSTFTSLSVSLSYSPPRFSMPPSPSHLPHTASKMLFSLHRHWILSRPVVFFPPWDCRSKSSRTNKIRARWPSRRPLFAMEYIQWLLSFVSVLIFQLYIYSKLVKNVPILYSIYYTHSCNHKRAWKVFTISISTSTVYRFSTHLICSWKNREKGR